jgi:DNA-binding transcriptional LysR family regulator
MSIVSGVNNPLSRRRKLALADIIDEPWLMTPDGNPGEGRLADACRALGLSMPRMTVFTDAPIMRNNLLATGRYVSVGLNSWLHFNAKRMGHKKLPIDLPLSRTPVFAVTLRQRTPPPPVKLFIDEAQQVAKEMGKPFV